MEKSQLVVDKIAGNVVSCERADGTMVSCPRSAFPENLKEGDLVQQVSSGSFSILQEETADKHKAAQSRLDALFGKAKSE